ncbi:OmpA family protein [Iamia majanohamensis]|uniref:OmpA family protein n=1 Tax=Iamia majanohamensis TaxID=467976 RepID=A0AAE9Y754_9ACTN|nr:OmpA family protein [Iamia majanohamensis]WCO66886.1 OmpA family protein [Iamia majanohamensis]
MTTTPNHPHRRARLVGVALAVAGLLATGCTGALRSGEDTDTTTTTEPAAELRAWPEDEPVVEVASPAQPDASVALRPLLREPDGTTTLVAEVTNEGSGSASLSSLFGFDGLVATRIVTTEGTVRHAPVAGDGGSPCLCSGSPTTVPSGATAIVHVTFADVDPGAGSVRVALPGWRPADDVPVRHVRFAPAPSTVTVDELAPDHEVAVQGAWRTPDGILLRVEDRNGTGDALSPSALADLADASVVDPATGRLGQVRTESSRSVAELAEDPVPSGRSVTRDVLVAAPGGDPDTVLVRIPGVRRSLPVTVADDAPTTTLAPDDLDEPRTATLDGPARDEGDLITLAEPDDVSADAEGPQVSLPDPGPALSSEAEPGWSVAARAVVRTGEARSTVYVDLTRSGSDRTWPQGLDVDLDDWAVIDPAERQRLGTLEGSDGADGSTAAAGVAEGTTRTLHVAVAPVADGSDAVSVDVPGFGTLADVPVVDGPEPAAPGDEVAASLVDDRSGEVRTDILSVGRLPGSAGVLVRARRVNDAAPDAFEPEAGLCDLTLSDPASGRRFQPLPPCVTTEWSRGLGVGEALVQEVRFPELPADVEAVVAELDGWLGSAPVDVADEAAPWYLDLPRPSDAPRGDTLVGSVGVADDLQSETRRGDEVELDLDTDVLFAFGSAEIAPAAAARLQEVGERLVPVASGTVEVVGHTDSVGDDAANQALSEQRAQAVADVLRPILGSSVELVVSGAGESDPVAANEVDGRDNPDGRARNRRVTITYGA